MFPWVRVFEFVCTFAVAYVFLRQWICKSLRGFPNVWLLVCACVWLALCVIISPLCVLLLSVWCCVDRGCLGVFCVCFL